MIQKKNLLDSQNKKLKRKLKVDITVSSLNIYESIIEGGIGLLIKYKKHLEIEGVLV